MGSNTTTWFFTIFPERIIAWLESTLPQLLLSRPRSSGSLRRAVVTEQDGVLLRISVGLSVTMIFRAIWLSTIWSYEFNRIDWENQYSPMIATATLGKVSWKPGGTLDYSVNNQNCVRRHQRRKMDFHKGGKTGQAGRWSAHPVCRKSGMMAEKPAMNTCSTAKWLTWLDAVHDLTCILLTSSNGQHFPSTLQFYGCAELRKKVQEESLSWRFNDNRWCTVARQKRGDPRDYHWHVDYTFIV